MRKATTTSFVKDEGGSVLPLLAATIAVAVAFGLLAAEGPRASLVSGRLEKAMTLVEARMRFDDPAFPPRGNPQFADATAAFTRRMLAANGLDGASVEAEREADRVRLTAQMSVGGIAGRIWGSTPSARVTLEIPVPAN